MMEGIARQSWPCGHDFTEANTKYIRNRSGVVCRACFRAMDKEGRARKREAERDA